MKIFRKKIRPFFTKIRKLFGNKETLFRPNLYKFPAEAINSNGVPEDDQA